MCGEGLLADLLARRFALACERIGLNRERRVVLDVSRFRPPGSAPQLDLF
jgi:hypothetical protein